jgi:hypothetical protein
MHRTRIATDERSATSEQSHQRGEIGSSDQVHQPLTGSQLAHRRECGFYLIASITIVRATQQDHRHIEIT